MSGKITRKQASWLMAAKSPAEPPLLRGSENKPATERVSPKLRACRRAAGAAFVPGGKALGWGCHLSFGVACQHL